MTQAVSNTTKRKGLAGRIVSVLVAVSGLSACGEPHPMTVVIQQPPAGSQSGQPHLSNTPGGNIVMSWLETEESTLLRFAEFDGQDWSAPATVAEGSDWFVNWADFPSVVPLSDDTWAAHWLRKTPGSRYSYDVILSLSADGGESWSDGIVPHDDNTPTEHGFVSLWPAAGGVGALWLDGRETSGHGHHDNSGGGMTLRSAVLGADGRIRDSQLIDPLICDCCQTDIAMTGNGPLAVYRDRSESEIRDIYASRWIDGKWSEGIPVANDGWQIAGCPVNGPSVGWSHDLTTVAWFTGADEEPRVRVAFSDDDGRSFTPPVDLDADAPLGRVAVLALDSRSSLVAWYATRGDHGASLIATRVSRNGEAGKPVEITTVDRSRLSGFPQLAAHNDSVVFAWTEVNEDDTQVASAIAPMALFPAP